MFGSAILEIAIGLVLVYLLMSLILTAVQEAISGFFKMRASNLEQALLQLLQGNQNLLRSFYEHPFIAALYKGSYETAVGRWRGKDLPSYIPRETFAAALQDLYGRAETTSPQLEEIFGRFQSIAGVDVHEQRRQLEQWYDGAMDRASGWYKRNTQKVLFWSGLIGSIVLNVNSISIVQYLAISPQQRQYVGELAERVAAAGPGALPAPREAPAPSAPGAGADTDGNSIAGRAAGAPQDAAAAGAEGNAAASATGTASPPDAAPPGAGAARESESGEAGNMAAADGNAAAPSEAQGGNLTGGADQPASDGASPAQPILTSEQLNAFTNELQGIGLPIGWRGSGLEWVKRGFPEEKGFLPNFLAAIMLIMGYLITALAMMLGAPFWFDILNKFMVVRATVKPKEKSPDEASEDRGGGRRGQSAAPSAGGATAADPAGVDQGQGPPPDRTGTVDAPIYG